MRFPKSNLIIFSTALVLTPLLSHAAPSEWRALFNGTDFTGWESYLAAPLATSDVPGAEKDAKGNYTKPLGIDNDPLKIFTIVLADSAPAIRISGEGYGVLSTKENFSNYHLRCEFKWGEKRFSPVGKPRNGGLMYHAHGDYTEWGGKWKSAMQFQVAEGTCGDFIVMGDTIGSINVRANESGPTDAKAPVYDPTPAGKPLVVDVTAANKGKCARAVHSENIEKPAGEWNTFEVVCIGDQVVHVLNGHVVARGEKLARKIKTESGAEKTAPLTSGQIQLQMEAAEEFFRNIEIRAIDAMPAEYANADTTAETKK